MNDPTIVCPLARLTGDPELKQSKTGRQYLRMLFASNGCHRDSQSGQWVEHDTLFFSVCEFDDSMIAAYRQQLRKGMACRVEGVLKWTVGTDNNGHPRVWFDVQFPRISVLVRKQASPQSQPQQPQQPQQPWGSSATAGAGSAADPWSHFVGDDFGTEPTEF
jgi:single-stranded DNA-binding protein